MGGRCHVAVASALLVVLAGCVGEGQATTAPPTMTGFADAGAENATDAGSIVGVVLDDESFPLPGADVTIVELKVSTKTTEAGAFLFNNVPYGTHRLSAYLPGYESDLKTTQVSAEEPEARVKLMLARIEVPVPRVSAHTATAMHHLGGALYLDSVASTLSMTCSGCKRFFHEGRKPDAVVIEVFGKHTLTNPQGDKELVWFSERNWTSKVGYNKPLPVYFEPVLEKMPEKPDWEVELDCESLWPCYEEGREMWVSFFHYLEVPEGYSARPK